MSETDDIRSRRLLSHLRRNLSPYVYISNFDSRSNTATLGLEIQEVVIDHSEKGQSTVKYYPLDNVASIAWKSERNKIKTRGLSSAQFAKRARNRFMTVTEHSQTALLPSLYKQLVRIPDVDMNMRPLRRILVGVRRHGKYSPTDFNKSQVELPKVMNYFGLLAGMGFIRPEDGHFVEGSEMKNLRAEELSPPQIYEFILGEVLRMRTEYLREILHWTLIVPYLRWCNAYYLPAYKANYLIQADHDELASYYTRYYGRLHDISREEPQLDQVVAAKILSLKEERYYEGKQPILDSFASNIEKDPLLVEALRS